MKTVKVSKKFQVVIPKKIRKEAGIKLSDKLLAISKHKVLQYVPVKSIKDSKGITSGLDTNDLRDETESH